MDDARQDNGRDGLDRERLNPRHLEAARLAGDESAVVLERDDWLPTAGGVMATQAVDGDGAEVTWYVHRDGLVEAAAFGDGRAAFFVVGRPQPYPTLVEARQVLARSH